MKARAYPPRPAAKSPDVSLLLAKAMPRVYASLIVNGFTIAQIAQVLPATAAAITGALR